MSKHIDLTGQKFGLLTVINKTHRKLKGNKSYKWFCRCECGGEKYVSGARLKGGDVKSCGCLIKLRKGPFKDILTKEYIEQKYVVENKFAIDIAKEIGEEHIGAVYGALKRHNIKLKGKIARTIGDLRIQYFKRIKERAIKKKLEFNITPEYIWNLFLQQEEKCILTGRKLNIKISKGGKFYEEFSASLDRIDSSKGYIENNVQWIHKDIQFIKKNLQDKELYNICKEIYLHSKERFESAS